MEIQKEFDFGLHHIDLVALRQRDPSIRLKLSRDDKEIILMRSGYGWRDVCFCAGVCEAYRNGRPTSTRCIWALAERLLDIQCTSDTL